MTKEEFLKILKDECNYLYIDLTDDTYLCPLCGSADIDEQRWVGINTGLVNEAINYKCYCNSCNSSDTDPDTVKIFIKLKKYLKNDFLDKRTK